MMRIPNNFCIKCNECGNVTLVIADDLDYETSVYDRPMGEEIENDFRGEICCDKCHSRENSKDFRHIQTSHVETCALLVRESAQDDEVVSIRVDLDGIEPDQGRCVPPEKPTYKNIKQWILVKYGFKVSTLYIAQIKDKVGLEKRNNYNPGSGEGKVPICPPEKEEAIMDAFGYFCLI